MADTLDLNDYLADISNKKREDKLDEDEEIKNRALGRYFPTTAYANARSLILARLNQQILPQKLVSMDDQYNTLHKLLSQTITAGESNSCVIIGNRGAGKTALVRTVIRDLKEAKVNEFCVVYLNGLTESTDKLALNKIASELLTEQDQRDVSFTSFADSFDYLLSVLKSGDKSSLPVIFILEEFDLFAQQPKQALLYNLFDAAQSAQNPMAVIGLTCRLDTLDLLEKRVKSRFSHRQIYVFPTSELTVFKEIAQSTLYLPETDAYSEKFNETLDRLFQTPVLNEIIRSIFDLTKDMRMFHRLCYEPVSNLGPSHPFLETSDFAKSSDIQKSDSKTNILKGIALLELMLIISMKKLREKGINVFNFQMVYEEYKNFMNHTQVKGAAFGMKLYKRAVALKGFESLLMYELICPVDHVGKCPKEYRMAKLALDQGQVTEAVLKADCPFIVKKWGTGALAV
ncbi:origin recognition complex subunit 4 C-terminus-domain-containing protein [Pilobolus umbonatus]|nr:origin recognition complex subunit 4 C-terminus-domain-containing protein [Pilobolus umbonatus]